MELKNELRKGIDGIDRNMNGVWSDVVARSGCCERRLAVALAKA